MRKAIAATLLLVLLATCLLLYSRSILGTLGTYWNNEQLVNFWAAWIPFAISILLAFIPDQQMKTKMRIMWRVLVILCGFFYSVLLWHQQTLATNASHTDRANLLSEAIGASNDHSDKKIGEVTKDVQGVKNDVQDVKKDLHDTISQSTSTLSETIGKNKPAPAEPARLVFSFFANQIADADFPISKHSASKDKDGNVSVDVFFTNFSGPAADAIDVWIAICDKCSFGAEPSGFDKPPGLDEHMRHKTIPLLNPGTSFQTLTIVVKPLQALSQFDIAFRYSCKVCGKVEKPQIATVFVQSAP